MPFASAELQKRVESILEDTRYFQAYWKGVVHFGTNDLVLIYEEGKEPEPLDIMAREAFIVDPMCSPDIAAHLVCPAAKDKPALSMDYIGFWFVAYFSNGLQHCAAVFIDLAKLKGGLH